MNMRCVFICLLFVVISLNNNHGKVHAKKRKGKKKNPTNHFSLQLKVKSEQIEDTLMGAKKLLDYGKKEKVAEPLLISLRAAVQKLEGHHRNMKKKEAKQPASTKNSPTSDEGGSTPDHEESEDAISFSAGKRRTRPLKSSMQAEKCNFPTYNYNDFQGKWEKGEVDIFSPFKIVGADDDFKRLREIWQLSRLRKKENSTLQYLSPMMAKMQMEGQRDPEAGQTVEMLQPQMVAPAEYFAKCFGNTKKTGTDTEYCEQIVPALHFGDDEIIDGVSIEAVGGIALKSVMDVATRKLLKAIQSTTANGMSDLVENEQNFKVQYQAKDSRKVRFGPAGSGTKMSYTGVPNLDGLVHGARRVFVMGQKQEKKYKQADGYGTAFNFFEDKLSELKDDEGLKISAADKIWECSQEAGEIIYVPVGNFRTSLSLQDSISYNQDLLMHVGHVNEWVKAALWQPQSQIWTAAVCLKEKDIMKLPDMDKYRKMISPGDLVRAFNKQLDTHKAMNGMILQAILVCKGVVSIELANQNLCGLVYPKCINQLSKNFKFMKLQIPDWLKAEKKIAKKFKKKKKSAKGEL